MEISARSRTTVDCSAEQAYDFVTSLEAPAKTFEGHGRIPGVIRTEVEGGGPLREGALCRVHGTDGSVMERLITVMDRPRRHEYRLAGSFKKPVSWLVRSGRGVWTFTPNAKGGTEVEWIYTFEATSPLALPFVYLLINVMFHKAMVKCLESTRQCLANPNPS